MPKRAKSALGDGLWQVEGVSAKEIDVLEGERRYPGDVRLADVPSFAGKLVERGLDVGCVPECDGVQRQAEGAELLFLFLAVGLSDLAAIAVANAAGQAVPELLAIELSEDASALFFAVDVPEQVQRLDDAAEFGERAGPLLHHVLGRGQNPHRRVKTYARRR